jgi:hypothetical protein
MARPKKKRGIDPYFDEQALGDTIPPQRYFPEDGHEGMKILRMRCKTLGMKLEDFVRSYSDRRLTTFYNNVHASNMRYQDIIRIAMVLRLNPADYLCYDPGINMDTVRSRLQRARIARMDRTVDLDAPQEKRLDDYFKFNT